MLKNIYQWREHTECLENCQRLVMENQNIQSWKKNDSILNDKVPSDKKNPIWKEKSKTRCLRT